MNHTYKTAIRKMKFKTVFFLQKTVIVELYATCTACVNSCSIVNFELAVDFMLEA